MTATTTTRHETATRFLSALAGSVDRGELLELRYRLDDGQRMGQVFDRPTPPPPPRPAAPHPPPPAAGRCVAPPPPPPLRGGRRRRGPPSPAGAAPHERGPA